MKIAMPILTFQRTILALAATWMLLLAVSCKEKPNVEKLYENGVFILNEGNFQGGNASLSFLHQPGDSVDLGIFKNALDRPLGDVAQSMQIRQDKAWIVVNNSGKIEVVNLPKLESHCSIQGLTSPRYLHFISDTKAYVTDLYRDSIAIINPAACSVSGWIKTGGWTEAMLEANGQIWVSQMGTDQVLVIDPATDQIIDSVAVLAEPNSMVTDASGKIWVMCDGKTGLVVPGLYTIDPVSRTANNEILYVDNNAAARRLRINPAGDQLYWLYDRDVYTMSTQPNSQASLLISGGNRNFYGLEVEPSTGNLYLLNARDYVQAGELLRFTPSGQAIDAFATGVIPSTMSFY